MKFEKIIFHIPVMEVGELLGNIEIREIFILVINKRGNCCIGGRKLSDHFKQGGFPMAIEAQHSNFITLIQREGDILEDGLMGIMKA